MESSASETESPVSATNRPAAALRRRKKKSSPNEQWPRKNKVALEGYVEAADGSDKGSESGGSIVGRTTSLNDEDLEELKGCVDLGFGFSYDEIPELCNTLPALNLCYSMSQRYLDEQRASDASSSDQDSVTSATPSSSSSSSPLVANWKISSPGEFLLEFLLYGSLLIIDSRHYFEELFVVYTC